MSLLEIILISVIIGQAILHYCERRDMYNRLMSKDYSDYRHNSTTPPNNIKHIPSAHDRVLNKWRNKVGDE